MSDAEGYLDLPGLKSRLVELEPLVAAPDLWDDADRARAVTTEYGRITEDVRMLTQLADQLDDAETLHQLGVEEDDQSVAAEVAQTITAVGDTLDKLELRSLFTGEYDEHDAVCEIHAGEGGTDAQDWAEMMLRMYQRWAERRGFGVEIDEVTEGQEAGILSATFIIKGRYAYGWITAERGEIGRAHV